MKVQYCPNCGLEFEPYTDDERFCLEDCQAAFEESGSRELLDYDEYDIDPSSY